LRCSTNWDFFDSYGSIGTELAIFAAHKNKKTINKKGRKDRPCFGDGFSANMLILHALWLGYRRY